MDLTFWQMFWLIIIFFVGIIAVKITFSFDINKHREQKQNKLRAKIMNYCPHMKFVQVGENYGVQSTFVSPSLTLAYRCQKCGLIKDVLDENEEKERTKYYFENPEELKKQEKEFEKLLKKAGFL